MIIATSDVHLGYSKSDKASFTRFLDWVAIQEDVTDLVLAGDILDFWRRDMVGVTIENADVIAKLINVGRGGVKVHYVAGNHDYAVRHLEIFKNRLKFSTRVVLVEDDVVYRFIHGWEMDPDQNPAFFDAMCYSNDAWGRRADRIWDVYLKWIDTPRKRIVAWLQQWWAKRDMEEMMKPPEERGFVQMYDAIASPLISSMIVTDEALIYGHTHVPCIIESENQANCGSWVDDGKNGMRNTYVVIDGNEVQLRRFG